MPAPGTFDNRRQLGPCRCPAQFFAYLSAGGHQYRGVARSARRHVIVDGLTDHRCSCIYHLAHRKPPAVAEIERVRPKMVLQVIQCQQMRLGQILDVHVIAHTGAIGRRIVITKHLQARASAQGRFQYVRNQVGLAGVRLANRASLVTPAAL